MTLFATTEAGVSSAGRTLAGHMSLLAALVARGAAATLGSVGTVGFPMPLFAAFEARVSTAAILGGVGTVRFPVTFLPTFEARVSTAGGTFPGHMSLFTALITSPRTAAASAASARAFSGHMSFLSALEAGLGATAAPTSARAFSGHMPLLTALEAVVAPRRFRGAIVD